MADSLAPAWVAAVPTLQAAATLKWLDLHSPHCMHTCAQTHTCTHARTHAHPQLTPPNTHTAAYTPQVAAALKQLGLHLDDSEVERLFSQLDITNTGEVGRSMVAASQVRPRERVSLSHAWGRPQGRAFLSHAWWRYMVSCMVLVVRRGR